MTRFGIQLLTLVVVLASWHQSGAKDVIKNDAVHSFSNARGGTVSTHTNNWAVLVCASRYWFNYRVSVCQFVVHITANRV